MKENIPLKKAVYVTWNKGEDSWQDMFLMSLELIAEEIEDPLMQKIRYLDKLIDELAKGKAMGKILRT